MSSSAKRRIWHPLLLAGHETRTIDPYLESLVVIAGRRGEHRTGARVGGLRGIMAILPLAPRGVRHRRRNGSIAHSAPEDSPPPNTSTKDSNPKFPEDQYCRNAAEAAARRPGSSSQPPLIRFPKFHDDPKFGMSPPSPALTISQLCWRV